MDIENLIDPNNKLCEYEEAISNYLVGKYIYSFIGDYFNENENNDDKYLVLGYIIQQWYPNIYNKLKY